MAENKRTHNKNADNESRGTVAPKTQIHQDLKTRIETCTHVCYNYISYLHCTHNHGVHVHKFVQININEQKIK